jgi:hypothetical protein
MGQAVNFVKITILKMRNIRLVSTDYLKSKHNFEFFLFI